MRRQWHELRKELIQIYIKKLNTIKKLKTIYFDESISDDKSFIDIKKLTMLFRINNKTCEIFSRLATKKCFYKYLQIYLSNNMREYNESAKFIYFSMLYNSLPNDESVYLHYYCITKDDTFLNNIKTYKYMSAKKKAHLLSFREFIYTERFFVDVCVINQIFYNSLIDSE
ncbi:hypothetical protein TUBRATIS_29690 [Tubulinosema ratisbonensis]|uniref:Uncharacterized protein n=1 Tax=Tubulinosema ratisbonensis TaxID=291195 RepID=A0A437AHE8_9MICR|nr:hypothetical protein TUBRATIS_29690 [Tubulinosema ratisbonensis]